MALSSLTVSGLAPNLRILGDRQSFEFTQNNTFFGMQNLFVPTLSTPSISNWEFKNNTFSGYRWSHVTDSTGGAGTIKLTYFLNDNPIGIDVLSFTPTGTFFNLPAAFPYPVNPTDATTKQYVDERIPSGQISSLTGFVSGINPVQGIMTTTRGSTCLLMNIPAGGNVDMGNFKLFNVLSPTNNNDAATKIYVDTRTWTTSQISNFIPSVLTFRLDQFVAPTSPINLNNQKIISLGSPTLGADATNKTYVDTAISTTVVTLQGDISGSGAVASPINTTFNRRLDQIAAPTNSLNLNSQKITNLATPVASTDGATRGFVDNSPVTIIGSVSGTGALSSSITTTLNTRLDQVPLPTASVSLNSQKITNLAAPTLGTDAANLTYTQAQSNISGTSGQIAITGANPKVISLINTAVIPGTYTGISQLIVDQQGRLTGISSLNTYQNLTYTAALTWNWDNGNIANLTLTGNTVLTIVPGTRQNGTLIVKQDSTGNRKITLITGIYSQGTSNPDAGLSGPGNKVDKLFFSVDINGAIYYDSISKDMRQVT